MWSSHWEDFLVFLWAARCLPGRGLLDGTRRGLASVGRRDYARPRQIARSTSHTPALARNAHGSGGAISGWARRRGLAPRGGHVAKMDSPKLALWRRGGRLPPASVSPAERRATSDLRRRRTHLLH